MQAADDSAREPHLATLLATALYTEGDLAAALEALDSVDADAVATDLVGVEWRACRVQLLSMLGRRDEAHALATETLRVAEAVATRRRSPPPTLPRRGPPPGRARRPTSRRHCAQRSGPATS